MNRLYALCLSLLLGAAFGAHAQSAGDWRASTDAERTLDAAAFKDIDRALSDNFTDVQSVVVAHRGRVLYEYYRDGTPGALRDVRSVAKSLLGALVGVALGQGRIASVDQPVLALVPEWAPLNADPRAAAITVRHLLTMTAGFPVNDPTGTAPSLPPREAWARPLAAAPGEKFAYDNSLFILLAAVLEKAVGMPLPDYARRHLVAPMGLQEPGYEKGLYMRTVDMARLGHLFLQKGQWGGQALIPESYVLAATQQHNAGGLPVQMPYGYLWWIVPSNLPRRIFMASGNGGQVIWVHPAQELVVAMTSTASADSRRRGHAIRLLLGPLLDAAQQRVPASVK